MARPSIFICYRRVDSGWAGRLEGELGERFGTDAVFRDRTIPAGVNWRTHIDDALAACKVMLVLIGPSWTQPTGPDGANRLWDTEDMVRKEIERGLQRSDVPIIPVTCDDAAMPTAAQLPPGLLGLCDMQAHPLSDGRWDYDAGGLCERIATFVPMRERGTPVTTGARMPGPLAGAMVAAATVTAWLAWPVAQSLPDRPRAISHDTSGWISTTVERVAQYAAERGLLWAFVAAVVLAAAYAGTRELRAGAPAGFVIGLSTGALGGAIGGALFIVLKDVAGVTSPELLNGIGVAIMGAVIAGRFAALGGGYEASTLRTIGLGGGLVAGALGYLLFGADGMLVFIAQAFVLIATLAAALAAPSLAPAAVPAGSAVKL
ncbi:MAG: hypothetical protein QOJ46_1197 [bacterium]